jgi:hypothetical protein
MNDLPERFKNRETRRTIATAVVAGLGGSQPPYLSIAGTAFTLVDSSGEQEAIETKYIDVVIIDVNEKVPVQRVFFGKGAKYDANDPKPPLCFSDNGIGASSQAQEPQSDNCKTCRWSKWTSDVSPMTGKGVPACKALKKLAVLPLDGDLPMYEFPFLLRVPVMSHDALQTYGNKFRGKQFDVSDVVTRISFAHGQVGRLEFEARKESPWVSDNVETLIETLLNGHATDSLIGRNDVPIQGQIAAPQQEPLTIQHEVQKEASSEVGDKPPASLPRKLGRPKKDGGTPLESSPAPQPPPPKPAPAGTARPLPSFLQPQTKAEPDKQPEPPTNLASDLQAALTRTFNLKV